MLSSLILSVFSRYVYRVTEFCVVFVVLSALLV